jgi:hypothetical protein
MDEGGSVSMRLPAVGLRVASADWSVLVGSSVAQEIGPWLGFEMLR